MKLFFIILIFLFPLFTFAQQSDSQLAYTYYQNKEYDKAAELFIQLYNRTHASNYLDYHIICLINGKQYDKAEDVLRKYVKADATNKEFLVNLGYVYAQQGKTQKSEEYYDRAIKKLIPQSGDISSLAYKFKNIREYAWAIKTYQQGQKLLKQPQSFLRELGECYMLERNHEKMLELYIQVLQSNPNEINNIISKLSFARSYDIINNVDGVIEEKLTAIFKQPEYNQVFDELAVWYALQKKNFPEALKHATLLNQKSEEKIYLFLNIAQEAKSLQNFSIASQSYKKILEKGKENNPYYATAHKELLQCNYQECLTQKAPQSAFQSIADRCKVYLQENGYNSGNADIAILLADLYAYQLSQPDSANHVLEKSIQIRHLPPNMLSLLKSKRADLLVFINNPWEATILYTQIEKANPNNDIGYEAKLKKAWLAYFSGDILWAKAQFDVLKGATTKLIANDAIQMSHFINMNYKEEEDNRDLEKMANTEYLIYKKQNKTALLALDSLHNHSQTGIADRAALKKAQILIEMSQYEEAIRILQRLKDQSEQTYTKAEAIFKLANLQKQLNALSAAKELYKLLVSEYSGSVYSVEAGKIYREMRE